MEKRFRGFAEKELDAVKKDVGNLWSKLDNLVVEKVKSTETLLLAAEKAKMKNEEKE